MGNLAQQCVYRIDSWEVPPFKIIDTDDHAVNRILKDGTKVFLPQSFRDTNNFLLKKIKLQPIVDQLVSDGILRECPTIRFAFPLTVVPKDRRNDRVIYMTVLAWLLFLIHVRSTCQALNRVLLDAYHSDKSSGRSK